MVEEHSSSVCDTEGRLITGDSNPTLAKRYRLSEIIGIGSFSQVYKAIDTYTGKHMAVEIKSGRSSAEKEEWAIRDDRKNPITYNSQRVAPRNSSPHVKLIEPLEVTTDSIEMSSKAGGEGTVINIVIENVHTTTYQQLIGSHFDMSMSTRDFDRDHFQLSHATSDGEEEDVVYTGLRCYYL